jgi:hypothetical protein
MFRLIKQNLDSISMLSRWRACTHVNSTIHTIPWSHAREIFTICKYIIILYIFGQYREKN